MAEEVTLPLPGKKLRVNRTALIVGVVVAGGIGYAYWRSKSQTSSTDDTSSTDAIDPLTGLPYSVESGTSTGVNSASGTSYDTSGTDESAGGITDAASWTADVVAKLGGSYDPAVIYDALGAYLAAMPLTNDQAAIVRAAWAASGKWSFLPQSYTLTGGGSTPGQPPPSGTVPALKVPAQPAATGWNPYTFSTSPVEGATSYEWYVDGAAHSHSTGPSNRFSISKRASVKITVSAGANGLSTAQSPALTLTNVPAPNTHKG